MVENKCGQIYFWTPLTALKENYSLTTATIGYGSCNFLFWGRNLMVSAFKWNLFSGTFVLLSFSILQSKSKFLFSFYFVRRVSTSSKYTQPFFFFMFSAVAHAPQYFPSDSNQLILPGPTALDNISMSTASLATHSHHTPAGPHQLHPGLSPFMANSSYSSASRSTIDMDLAHKETDRSKCLQPPGLSLHPTWNTLGQA